MSQSLADFKGFVNADAFRIVAVPFKPEDTSLGVFTFLPWVRTGIAAAVNNPAAGDLRASVTVNLPVQSDNGAGVASQHLFVRGPGDVLGFDEQQVVRRYPEQNATTAEDVFLAHIEFDRPDFPWIFTPRAHDGERLAPWIALVVVQDGPALRQRPGEGPLPPIFSIPMGELQPIDDASAWAWAHAQAAGGVKDIPSGGVEGVPAPGVDGAPSVDDRLSPSNALANLSRLVCPRRLQPDTAYVACVVPTFDAGVKTGRGLADPGTLGPAWTRAAGDEANVIDLPVYSHWRFQTGPEGDFRTLAERLTGMPAPWYVGRRMLDTANPRGRMGALAAGDSGVLQVVKGPLVAPAEPNPQSTDPAEAAGAIAESAAWAAAKTNELRALLNEPDRLAAKPGALLDADFPRVGPSIYARYQAATTRIGDVAPTADPAIDATWLNQLNLRPANRVVAGLGTRVVQMDQEQLMQAAWAQVGAIEQANQQIRWAQIGRFAGASFHARNLIPLPFSSLLTATRRLHSRVLVADQTTLTARIAQSATPISAVTATFRRATRVEGPIARYAVGDARAQMTNLLGEQATPRDFQRSYVELDGIAGLSSQSFSLFDQAHVASVFGGRTLDDVSASLGSNSVVRTIQDRAATAFAANPALFPVDLGASQVMKSIATSMPKEVTGVRGATYAAALAGLQATNTKVAEQAGRLLTQLTETNRLTQEAAHANALVQAEAPGTPAAAVAMQDAHAKTVNATKAAADLNVSAISVSQDVMTAVLHVQLHPALGQVLMPHLTPAVIAAPPILTQPLAPNAPVLNQPIAAQPLAPNANAFQPRQPQPVLNQPGNVFQPVQPPVLNQPLAAGAGEIALFKINDVYKNQMTRIFTQDAQVAVNARVAAFDTIPSAFVQPSWPTTPVRPALALDASAFLAQIHPALTVTARIEARLVDRPAWIPLDWFKDGLVQPIMAAPVFTRPMYQALAAYDQEWFIPGLDRMKAPVDPTDPEAITTPNFVTLLETNDAFIESYFIGLSDAMGSELLWRGYPTDKRGTYFRRFWRTDRDDLAAPIHEFAPGPLGDHLAPDIKGKLVLLARGDLIRRYPDALVFALKKGGQEDGKPPTFVDGLAEILFHVHMAPDIVLVGFNLKEADVQAQDWWFFIGEHPVAPRFGLVELRDNSEAKARDNLEWNDLPTRLGRAVHQGFLDPTITDQHDPVTAAWGTDAASTAILLLRDPVRAAFDGRTLLGDIKGAH